MRPVKYWPDEKRLVTTKSYSLSQLSVDNSMSAECYFSRWQYQAFNGGD